MKWNFLWEGLKLRSATFVWPLSSQTAGRRISSKVPKYGENLRNTFCSSRFQNSKYFERYLLSNELSLRLLFQRASDLNFFVVLLLWQPAELDQWRMISVIFAGLKLDSSDFINNLVTFLFKKLYKWLEPANPCCNYFSYLAGFVIFPGPNFPDRWFYDNFSRFFKLHLIYRT